MSECDRNERSDYQLLHDIKTHCKNLIDLGVTAILRAKITDLLHHFVGSRAKKRVFQTIEVLFGGQKVLHYLLIIVFDGSEDGICQSTRRCASGRVLPSGTPSYLWLTAAVAADGLSGKRIMI